MRFAGLGTIIARSRKPSEASAKEGSMYYVYLIESLSAAGKRYVGITTNLDERLQDHDAGKSSHLKIQAVEADRLHRIY